MKRDRSSISDGTEDVILDNSDTRIAKSSIAGCGLFASRNIDRGTWLSIRYPGERTSWFAHLNDFMIHLTNKPHHTKADLHRLKELWNIEIIGDQNEINWDSVYDSLIVYRMDNGNDKTFYWNRFNAEDGSINTDTSNACALYINEPPAGKYFTNAVTGARQTSRVNVAAYTLDDGNVGFLATRDIERDEEILMYYGETFQRNYEINI